jgi:Acetyltransferase (GNAT) domain
MSFVEPVHHELVPLADRAGWEAALENVPHSFFHTWNYNDAIAATTQLHPSLFVCHSTPGRVVCPLIERPFERYVDVATPPGFPGPVGTYARSDFLDELALFANGRGWVSGYIALDPTLAEDSLASAADAFHHNDVYVLDLTAGETGVAKRLSRNRHRELRVHDDVRLIVLPEPIEEFLVARVGAHLRARGASPAACLSEETIRRLCRADQVWLVAAQLEGQIHAAAAFASTASSAVSVLHIATPHGRKLSVHLVWRAVRHYAEKGVAQLNLGGGVRPGDSVAEFKRRFGARVVPLVSLRQVFDQSTFRQLCARAGQDADDRSGYFPPYRRTGAGPA